MEPAFYFMKKLFFASGVLLILSLLIPYVIESKENAKPIKRTEEIAKNLLYKGEKLKIDLSDARNYYQRGIRQVILQDNKTFFLRDYTYASELFQKSIDISIKKIKFYKEKERTERADFIKKLEETKDLNFKIREVFERIPLGSDFYIHFLKSYANLKEAENLYEKNMMEKAKMALLRAQSLNEKLFNNIKESLRNFYSPEKLGEWKKLYNEALSLSHNSNVIVVIKDERILKVLRNGKVFRLYSVEFGKNPLSKKTKSGDLATPEGRYKITEKRGYGRTKYYLALLLNYPNEEDRKRFEEAKRKGLIPKNSKIGGLIEIHGDGGLGIDWTEGCVALSNEDMKELYNLTSVGTEVFIIGSLGNNDVLSNLQEVKTWKNSKNS